MNSTEIYHALELLILVQPEVHVLLVLRALRALLTSSLFSNFTTTHTHTSVSSAVHACEAFP